MILVILLIISVVLLIVYWMKGRNAVWGGATIGVVIGIIISLIWKNWSLLGWSFAVGTLAGVGAELLAWAGNKLRQRR